MARIQRIRKKIIDRAYYLSYHAEEEMLDDELTREEIENAVLNGRIEKRLSEDIRGTRYRIQGPARDGRLIQLYVGLTKIPTSLL
jgi:hypothetical protein